MIVVKEALPNEFNIIQDIAYKTWPKTYGNIVSEQQLDYMLNAFYSLEGLNKNVANSHHFLLANEGETTLGFASYVHNYQNKSVTKIPKIYILPEAQGKGVGKILIDAIALLAISHGSEKLTLNVNRFNPAKGFYEKLGFDVVAEEDIKLDHGYLMEDYIMEKLLP